MYYLMKRDWLKHEEYCVIKQSNNLEELQKLKSELKLKFRRTYSIFQLITTPLVSTPLEKRKQRSKDYHNVLYSEEA